MSVNVSIGDPLSGLPQPVAADADSISDSPSSLVRNKSLFNQAWFSDASLLVGPNGSERLIPIHSPIVAAASTALAALLGPNRKTDGKPVRMTDFRATVVLSALRWMYCDEIVFLMSDWDQLLEFACRFLMKHLVTALVAKVTVDKDNLWSTFSLAFKLNCQPLMRKCMDFFVPRTELLLSSPGFLKAPVQLVAAVTRMDPLNISEYDLFKRCHAWAKEECARIKLDPTSTAMRSVMVPFLKNIAFCTMRYDDLVDVGKTGILTDQERLRVFDWKSDPSIVLPFSTKTRSRSPKPACGKRRESCPVNNDPKRYCFYQSKNGKSATYARDVEQPSSI